MMMENLITQEEDISILSGFLSREIQSASGKKGLEFGCARCPMGPKLRDQFEYLTCTDKSDLALEAFQETANVHDIRLIPTVEIGEDCYFGRFHIIFGVFSFHDLPHLVDEIMALRRLIIKGGKLTAVDYSENGFDIEFVKQLKRCGFTDINIETATIQGMPVFLISAIK